MNKKKESIETAIAVLNQISVSGKQNCFQLAGAIDLLERVLLDMDTEQDSESAG